MKTLNEVVDLVDMTRRVIQEYEKAGLAKTPTTINKYGHLQYDESAIDDYGRFVSIGNLAITRNRSERLSQTLVTISTMLL